MKKKVTLFTVILSTLFIADRGLCQIPPLTTFQRFDFVPGNKILFEETFADDAVGALPARWTLKSGRAVVNTSGMYKAFFLTDARVVQPAIKNAAYLTKNFSIEYDFFPTGNSGTPTIEIDAVNNGGFQRIYINSNAANWTGYVSAGDRESPQFNGALPADLADKNFDNKWHHVIIAYEHDQMKVYLDKYRVLAVPHCNGLAPATMLIYAGGTPVEHPVIIKNFKIVDGAHFYLTGQPQN
jgi:OmpA-OmpF porin, OOP family